MNLRKRTNLLFLLLAIIAVAVFFGTRAFAQGNGPPDNRPPDNRPPGNPGNVDVDIGGDTINVGGNTVNTGDVNVPVGVDVNAPSNVNNSMSNETKTFAFSNSLGDVDIAGCLGSTQWATPIFSKQGLVINWPCMAEFYLRNQKYELAAMAICNTEIVKEFGGKGISKEQAEASCEEAHSFGPTLADLEPAAAAPSFFESAENHQEDVSQIQMQQQALQEEVQDLRSQLEQQQSRPPPRVVERVVQEPEPLLTDAEKYAILSLLTGADEDEGDE